VPKDGGFEYEYFIKVAAERKSRPFGNHLGNTRLTVQDSSGMATIKLS
jgi:hypothetical protein